MVRILNRLVASSLKGVRMRRTLLLGLLLPSLALANPVQTFSQGTLIIPMQSSFQSKCGTAGAYGLIWKLLYENRPGGLFTGSPVTIYWVVNDAKTSPNRCVPTNKHASPTASGLAAGVSGWDTGPWNDGCDFSIPNGTGAENTATMPVVQVSYTTLPPASPAPFIYPTTNTITEFDTAATARPSYNTAAATSGKGQRPANGQLNNTGTCVGTPCGTARFTKIQYEGGAFIIDASDARRVIEAMTNGTAPYAHLNYHTSSSTTCPFGDATMVYMHQATQSFDAPVYKRMTNTPPKIALLDYGGGASVGVLTPYLNNAGLNASINGVAMGGTPLVSAGVYTGTYGILYDRLRGIDDLVSTATYPQGFLNSKLPGGKARYKVFWTPHWVVSSANLLSGAATAAQRVDALNNLAYFTNQKGNGLMAECASIDSYEGSVDSTASESPQVRFMYNNSADATRGITHNNLSVTRSGRNCTDPDYLALGSPRPICTRYMEPADPFSQIGDFTAAYTGGGHVTDYRPAPSTGARNVGVKRLGTSWVNWSSGSDDSGDNGWDFYTLTQKDNDPEKATVIYIAGHNISGDVGGTRIILNTLLNLGADPIPSDRNYTQSVGFIDATNGNLPTLFTSIYATITGTLLSGSTSFTTGSEKNWMWPFTKGNLRARSADTGLVAGVNELTDAVIWNADGEMPLPDNRNLFTYFGGTAKLTSGAKNAVAQSGWIPERIEHTRINSNYGSSPNPNCVDVQRYGDYLDKVGGNNTGGLIAGSDGICDLQQALMWSNFTFDVGGGGSKSMPPGHLMQLGNDVPVLKSFVQLIRGFCYAESAPNTPIMTPTDAECVATGSVGDNKAHLGGAVRSSAAIVPPSTRVKDATAAARPTVAYIGTWDGQLHAIYVGGGANYAGTLDSFSYFPGTSDAVCSAPATCTSPFKTNWATSFAGGATPNRGTELWSFLPASQLPHVRGNNARVDSTPVVQDVFIDTDGSGIRKWHTVLVVSIGGSGREIFAMDVSNPLKPVLLWDVVGSNAQVGSFPDFAAVARNDYTVTGEARPLEWDNSKADFILPPLPDQPGGRTQGYAYDYSELGGSRTVSIGQMREGLEPTYGVFVSSSASGYGAASADALGRAMTKGLQVFAIDVATGQKLWQWSQPYVVQDNSTTRGETAANRIGYRLADNSVPSPVTVRSGADGASTLYVGDMEGRIWELDAATGVNLNAFRDTGSCAAGTTKCNFAAFDTHPAVWDQPQPVTSNLAIAKLPGTVTGALAPYINQDIMVLGTAGTDWVPNGVAGKIHTLLLEQRKDARDATAVTLSTSNARSSSWGNVANEFGGVLQEPPDNQTAALDLTGSYRVYGNISITGQVAYAPLVDGQGGDPMSLAKTLGGKTLELNLGAVPANQAAAELANFNLANFGGVAVFSIDRGGGNLQTLVLSDQVSKTSKLAPPAGPPAADPRSRNTALSTNRSLPYRIYNVVRRFFSQQ